MNGTNGKSDSALRVAEMAQGRNSGLRRFKSPLTDLVRIALKCKSLAIFKTAQVSKYLRYHDMSVPDLE